MSNIANMLMSSTFNTFVVGYLLSQASNRHGSYMFFAHISKHYQAVISDFKFKLLQI